MKITLIVFILSLIFYCGYEKGYSSRVALEQKTLAKAQPIIEKGRKQFETQKEKIKSTSSGHCGVAPNIAFILDELRTNP